MTIWILFSARHAYVLHNFLFECASWVKADAVPVFLLCGRDVLPQ